MLKFRTTLKLACIVLMALALALSANIILMQQQIKILTRMAVQPQAQPAAFLRASATGPVNVNLMRIGGQPLRYAPAVKVTAE